MEYTKTTEITIVAGHLGFYVEWPDYDDDTLGRCISVAEKKGWEWRIERGEGGE